MYTITKEFKFDAAHQLNGLPVGHKCGRLHGHSYTVIVELKSEKLDENGFVTDYGELRLIKEWIDNFLDHSYLNEKLISTVNSTAEWLAKEIFLIWKNKFPNLSAITVKETEKTSARYEPTNN